MNMNEMIAKRMERLAPSGIRKMNEKALEMERAGEPVLHFEIGRPDFDTPEYIKKACIDSITAGDVFYTSSFGILPLREAIANKLRTQNKIDCKASEIMSVSGRPRLFTMCCAASWMREMKSLSRIPYGSTT